MNELKTLKDLPLLDMQKDMLKREAIKWVKRSIIMQSKDRTEYKILNYDGSQAYAIVDWIKHFHNITEEDLK